MCPRSALAECFSVMRAKDRRCREKGSGASNSRATGAKGDEKFYEHARRHRRHWFELHQLKKAVPQKFHNAASRRVASGLAGVVRGARRVKCPSFRRFSAFPRRGKALLFVRAPFCCTTDNDRSPPRLRHQS